MTDAELAQTIRTRLASAGVQQQHFARSVGMEPSALSKALHGIRRFSAAEATRIREQLARMNAAEFGPEVARFLLPVPVKGMEHLSDYLRDAYGEGLVIHQVDEWLVYTRPAA